MNNPRRLVTADKREDDAETSLRPQRLDEFVGQEQARANLKVFIEAARARKEDLERRRWRRSWRGNLASTSAPHPVR